MTAREPEDPTDPLELRHWWATREAGWTYEDFLVESGGEVIGFASHRHAPWALRPTRYADVQAVFAPPYETKENLDAGYDAMEERARRESAAVLTARVRENRADLLAYLQARGYQEDPRCATRRARACASRTSRCSRSRTTATRTRTASSTR
jgi:hypothetical protein